MLGLGEDWDFATGRRLSSVTLQLKIAGGCVLGVRVRTKNQILFLVPGNILQQRWSFMSSQQVKMHFTRLISNYIHIILHKASRVKLAGLSLGEDVTNL